MKKVWYSVNGKTKSVMVTSENVNGKGICTIEDTKCVIVSNLEGDYCIEEVIS